LSRRFALFGVIGARKGRDEDFAISVYFEDTGDQEWFAPHLVKVIEPGVLGVILDAGEDDAS
jgi:hypothetical protein